MIFFILDAIFNDEPDLAMFRYEKQQIVSHQNLDHDIKMQIPQGVF